MTSFLRRAGFSFPRIVSFCLVAGFTVYASLVLASQGEVAVSGTRLLRDSSPWAPRGLNIDAFDAPRGYEEKETYVWARQKFGVDQLEAMKAFGADLIRLVVSQQALDPQAGNNPPKGWTAGKSAEYTNEVISAVRSLRDFGFSVLLQMNDNKLSYFGPGKSFGSELPGPGTVRAWNILAPVFSKDSGVLFGLFNEPFINRNDPEGWDKWQRSHQPVIDAIRASGATNIIVVEGVAAARQLENRFGSARNRLRDPEGRLVYGVHPYFDYDYPTPENNPRVWDANWGDFSKTNPVIASEWTVSGYLKSGCRPTAPRDTAIFLKYLADRKIGVVAWSWDVGSSLQWNAARSRSGQRISSFRNFSCNPPSGGPGEMLHQFFTTGQVE